MARSRVNIIYKCSSTPAIDAFIWVFWLFFQQMFFECILLPQEGDEEWFVLGDESSEGVGPGIPFEDEGTTKAAISDPNMEQKGESVNQVSTFCSNEWLY